MMKKIWLLFIITICFGACRNNPDEVVIRGEITGTVSDTVFLFASDELSQLVDTLYINNNKISHRIPADTLTQVTMVIDGYREYPLYLENGKKITIKGDLRRTGFLDIQGNIPNEELTRFNKALMEIPEPTDSIIDNIVGEYIRLNQASLINIYLLDKYFVQKLNPDIPRIRDLVSILDGVLQDKPYIEKLLKTLELEERGEIGKASFTFNLPNADGEKVGRLQFRNKFLLIHFWASWSGPSRVANKELRNIHTKFAKNDKFAMVGISLDLDKAEWLQAIEADSVNWEQLCDFTGWDNEALKQYAVHEVPYNILLGTDGKIKERGIENESLILQLDSLLATKKK